MVKKEFVSFMSKLNGDTKVSNEQAFDDVCIAIKEALLAGEEVRIKGVGVFFLKEVPEHEARNPANGEKVVVPTRNKARFKFVTEFKEAVNELPVG